MKPAAAHPPMSIRGIGGLCAAGPARRRRAKRRGGMVLAGMLVLMLLACGGCVSPQERQARQAVQFYWAGEYTQSIAQLRPLAERTDENFVLNNLRLGSAALATHDLAQAEGAFLRAYEVLNSVGVNRGGRTLGAVLVDERLRIWRGEPFERAMANFYLGLVYAMQEDHANARAAFENALFKLRDYGEDRAVEDQYRESESNFALAYVMLGRTWQRLGRDDHAQAHFRRALELQPSLHALADPQVHRRSNVLLVIDYGVGPRRATQFDGSIVGFEPHPAVVGPPPRPRLSVNGQMVNIAGLAIPPVDLLALAQDRRWQSIDTIRTVKSAVGTGLLIAGAYQGLRREPDYGSALALAGAGLLLKATSQADTRSWEMLPRTTYLIPLHLPPGRHDLTVSFPQSRQTWHGLSAPEEGDAIYYLRLHRWNMAPYHWPPTPAVATTPARTP